MHFWIMKKLQSCKNLFTLILFENNSNWNIILTKLIHNQIYFDNLLTAFNLNLICIYQSDLYLYGYLDYVMVYWTN